MQNLEIVIRGRPKSGKTQAAILIDNVLAKAGFCIHSVDENLPAGSQYKERITSESHPLATVRTEVITK